MSKVLVLSSKLQFKNSFPSDVISKFSNPLFTLSDNTLEITLFEWYDKDTLDNYLQDAIQFGKQLKNSLTGDLIVSIKNENTQTAKYHVSRNKFIVEDCDVLITTRKHTEKKKLLTDSEKITLFKEYWDLRHTLPDKNEVYKEFKIGLYYMNLAKNDELFKLINEVIGE